MYGYRAHDYGWQEVNGSFSVSKGQIIDKISDHEGKEAGVSNNSCTEHCSYFIFQLKNVPVQTCHEQQKWRPDTKNSWVGNVPYNMAHNPTEQFAKNGKPIIHCLINIPLNPKTHLCFLNTLQTICKKNKNRYRGAKLKDFPLKEKKNCHALGQIQSMHKKKNYRC